MTTDLARLNITTLPSDTLYPPLLPAYRHTWRHGSSSLVVWCFFCRAWHFHGMGNGHRVAHCHNPASPYDRWGYILWECGTITTTTLRRWATQHRAVL